MTELEQLKKRKREIEAEIKRIEKAMKEIRSGMLIFGKKSFKYKSPEEFYVSVYRSNEKRPGHEIKGQWIPFIFGNTEKEIVEQLEMLVNEANELMNKIKEKNESISQ